MSAFESTLNQIIELKPIKIKPPETKGLTKMLIKLASNAKGVLSKPDLSKVCPETTIRTDNKIEYTTFINMLQAKSI